MFVLAVSLLCMGCIGGGHGWMEQGNRLYRSGQYAKAGEIYGNLAVELPGSPHVQNNLGLARYREQRWDEAISAFEKGLTANASRDAGLENNLAYNLGDAYFRLSGQEAAPARQRDLLRRSLAAFKRAIVTDPRDMEAKFNYELVKRLLEQKDQGMNEDQDSEGRQDDNEDEQQQQEQRSEPRPTPGERDGGGEPPAGELTPEQAQAILKQAESLEKYGAILVPGSEQPVGKDW